MTTTARPGVGAVLGALALLVATGCTTERSLPADSPPPPAAVGAPRTAPAPMLRQARDYVFPVRGPTSYSRAHHDYPASDIFADCGTPVVAPVSGVVLELGRRDRYAAGPDDPALRGGRSWSLRGDDGTRYYGSHLASLAEQITPGDWLRAGERIGRVGESGNAAGTGCHLHFGISPVCAGTGDWWVRRGTVSPYPFLRAWERDRNRPATDAVDRWRGRHGCPREPH